ncbi:MAG: hypothetical protein K2P59_13295 [Acetatifactor sp.]|nr:hypothetical protein [Acetatifactor sp.]
MSKEGKGWIRRIFEKFILHRKLKGMDEMWELYGGSCFGLFPPSFYHKHSEEEILRRKQEEIAQLKQILDEFVQRNQDKL